MLYVMTWFRLLLFSIFVANSVWWGGVPGDFVLTPDEMEYCATVCVGRNVITIAHFHFP